MLGVGYYRILRAAKGQARKQLSLGGSFEALERTTGPFMDALRDGNAKSINGSGFQQAMIELRTIEKKLDPRTVKYHTEVSNLLIFARRNVDRVFGNQREYEEFQADLRDHVKRTNSAWDTLRKDPAVIEELER